MKEERSSITMSGFGAISFLVLCNMTGTALTLCLITIVGAIEKKIKGGE